MKLLKTITLGFVAGFACSPANGQTVVDSVDIYIKQSPGENSELPENRTQLSEQPILNQNTLRSISLYYRDQDEWVTISSSEDLQWGTAELIEDSEDVTIEVMDRDSSLTDSGRTERLAELLGNMISGQRNRGDNNSDESATRVTADEEMMNAFRDAFEAVMQEENGADEESDENEPATVELPVMYGNVDGIVLDETRSKTGRDFYKAFYNAWSKRKGAANSVVRVAEKPGPGMASVVFVEVNYEEIFELRLRPGDQRTEQAGEIAAARTLSFLKENSNKPLTY